MDLSNRDRYNEFVSLMRKWDIKDFQNTWKYSNWNRDNDYLSDEEREVHNRLVRNIFYTLGKTNCDIIFKEIECKSFDAFCKKRCQYIAEKIANKSVKDALKIMSKNKDGFDLFELEFIMNLFAEKTKVMFMGKLDEISETIINDKKKIEKSYENQIAELKEENAKLLAHSHKLAEICEIIKQ